MISSPIRPVVYAKSVVAVPMTDPNEAAGNPEDENTNINIDEPWMGDDAIERSGNLFSQLDSMIAAVQSESNAMDMMREKLKELDQLKTQISSLSKRLLEADQSNLTIKGHIIKLQESYSELKKSKAESDAAVGPLRTELAHAKEMFGKERSARMNLQQELVTYKDQCSRLEQINEELQGECKTIPTHIEACELLKNDLSKVRKQYQGEKKELVGKVRMLEKELSVRDMEGLKTGVRNLALRLLDISTSGTNNGGPSSIHSSQMSSSSSMKNYGNGSSSSYQVPTITSTPSKHSPYRNDFEEDFEDEDGGYYDEDDGGQSDGSGLDGSGEDQAGWSPGHNSKSLMQSTDEEVRQSCEDIVHMNRREEQILRAKQDQMLRQEHGRRSKSGTVVYHKKDQQQLHSVPRHTSIGDIGTTVGDTEAGNVTRNHKKKRSKKHSNIEVDDRRARGSGEGSLLPRI